MVDKTVKTVKSMMFLTPNGERTTYSVGQPMGFYSSFPILDICNFIVAVSTLYDIPRIGKGLYPFSIVGDDIVFHSLEISVLRTIKDRYIDTMERLGVEVNYLKTFSNGLSQAVGTDILYDKEGNIQ